jgi:hypothetical protein
MIADAIDENAADDGFGNAGSGRGTLATVDLDPYSPMHDPLHFDVDYSDPIEAGPMGLSFKDWNIQDLAMVIGKNDSSRIADAS